MSPLLSMNGGEYVCAFALIIFSLLAGHILLFYFIVKNLITETINCFHCLATPMLISSSVRRRVDWSTRPLHMYNNMVPVYTLTAHSNACTDLAKCLPATFFSLGSLSRQFRLGE